MDKKVPVYGTSLMQAYRAERANGASIESARNIARGDYARNQIALDWYGCTSAEARVGDYDITVEVKQDEFDCRENHLCGDFEDEEKYRLLPWGGNRRFQRRYVLASALTQQEIAHRTSQCTHKCRGKKCNHEHKPSTRYDRDMARESWNVWYIDYTVVGGMPKGKKQNQRDADVSNAALKHDQMDWYWRHGYSKSDAYVKAMEMQHKAAAYASSDLEYYDVHIIVTRADDDRQIAESWHGGFDVDGSEPQHKAFAYIKEDAAVLVSDALGGIRKEQEQRHGVEQMTFS